MAVTCVCAETTLLEGEQADDYGEAHLVPDEIINGSGEAVYRCPLTGIRFVGEFGVAGFRLRRLMRAAELVEMLALQGDTEVSLDWTDERVEFRPPGSAATLQGIDEARRLRDRDRDDPNAPRMVALSVVEVDDERAVVLGDIAYRRGGGFIEHQPAAWLVETRNGLIARSLWFDSWQAARHAAGLREIDGALGKRIARRFLFLVGRLRPASAA